MDEGDRMLKFHNFILIALFAGLSFGQNNEWRCFTYSESIAEMAQESDTIWLATSGGLIAYTTTTGLIRQYDRSNSGIPDNRIRCVTIASDGTKWVGTYFGLAACKNGAWEVFYKEDIGSGSNTIHCIIEGPDGSIWVGTYTGLYRYSASTWHEQEIGISELVWSDNISALAMDSSSNILAASEFGGIAKFDGTTWSSVSTSESCITNTVVRDLTVMPNGELWVGIQEGVTVINSQSCTTYTVDNSPLSSGWVSCIRQDSEGAIWLGCGSGFTIIYNEQWETLQIDSIDQFSNIVKGVAFAPEGNTWIGTAGGLVEMNNDKSFSRHKTSNSGLASNEMWSLDMSPSGKLWAGASLGFTSFDGQIWTSFNYMNSDMFTATPLNYGFSSDGSVWFATVQGLGRFGSNDSTFLTSSNSNLITSKIYDVAVDSHGIQWLATVAGPVKLNGTSCEKLTPYDTLGVDWQANCVAVTPDGKVWFGFEEEGVASFDGQNWQIFNQAKGDIRARRILSITIAPDGNPWIGMEWYGATFYHGNEWSKDTLSTTSFSSGTVRGISFDSDGTAWLATDGSGLVAVSGDGVATFNQGNSRLPEDRLWGVAVDSDDNIWLATRNNGIALFNEDGITLDAKQMPARRKSPSSSISIMQSRNKICFSLDENPNPSSGILEAQVIDLQGRFVAYFDVYEKQLKTEWTWNRKTKSGQDCVPGVYTVCVKEQHSSRPIAVSKLVLRPY
ncbi:MAG: hypothetical protein GF311_28585 [Candidatus Lokiarchaeota archaeon]|nr:hypothetical protein [Candidatus Lokiarchaeota archaeon]